MKYENAYNPFPAPRLPESSGVRPAAADAPVQRWGHYDLVRRLGHGGMGEVWLAFRSGPVGIQRPVALKRPKVESTDMFVDEVRVCLRLHHPNIVQTLDVGEVDGVPFMVMEYLTGQPLPRVLPLLSSPQRIGLALRMCVDVLDGLHYAHELRDYDGVSALDVVHRDVSPANIFACYDGRVRLLDFGIAKAAIQSEITARGQMKGKCAYASPEQMTGSRVDRRSDLWSVGVVLWELLTGKPLFVGETLVETLSNTLSREVVAPSGVPPRLQETVLRALRRKPDERYASAREMRDELLACCAAEGIAVATQEELAEFLAAHFSKEKRRASALVCRALEAIARNPQTDSAHEDAKALQSSMALPSLPARGGRRVKSWTVVAAFALAGAVAGLWPGDDEQPPPPHAERIVSANVGASADRPKDRAAEHTPAPQPLSVEPQARPIVPLLFEGDDGRGSAVPASDAADDLPPVEAQARGSTRAQHAPARHPKHKTPRPTAAKASHEPPLLQLAPATAKLEPAPPAAEPKPAAPATEKVRWPLERATDNRNPWSMPSGVR